MAPIALLAVRTFQILCAAVVLGLSINVDKFWNTIDAECKATKGCSTKDSGIDIIHTVFRYGAFVGAFGLIDAFLGLAAAFVSSLMWLIPLVIDGLAAVFFLAGGCVSIARFGRCEWWVMADCDAETCCSLRRCQQLFGGCR